MPTSHPLSIGLPVYNGERFLPEVLKSLSSQTFEDWNLLVSDNASTDGTKDIIDWFATRDRRIRSIRHNINIGAIENFKFVLSQAYTPYFMWAAADDRWDADFLQTCLYLLEQHPERGMAFTGLCNIDDKGQHTRRYPEIGNLSGKASIFTITRYLCSPEAQGKANLIYSVYRTTVCKNAMKKSPLTDAWGSDMCFVLTALSMSGIIIDPSVLFHKRLITQPKLFDDDTDNTSPYGLLEQSCPLDIFPSYMDNLLEGVAGTKFFPSAFLALKWRHHLLRRLDAKRRGIPPAHVRAFHNARWFFTGRTPSISQCQSSHTQLENR